jgi:CBS domain-containing protein
MTETRPTDHIGQLTSTPVATIGPAATLREAAQVLAAEGVGLLVVVDANGIRGVLSERDVVSAAADGADLDEERVRDHANDDPVTMVGSRSVLDAAAAMMAAEIRHLVVTDQDEAIGVVSIRDVCVVLMGSHMLLDHVETVGHHR